jgi:predicted nucleic acid-binding protein
VSDFVIDASAMVFALTETTDEARAFHERLVESTMHAPHLIDAEVGHVLRRLERAGILDEEAATTALYSVSHLIDHRYPHVGSLAKAAWQVRHTITFYDGLYVTLAARLRVPLLTSDEKLTNAPGLPCEFELV